MTPVIAAAGGAAVAFPHVISDFDANLPRVIGSLTVVWLLTQITFTLWKWAKAMRKDG